MERMHREKKNRRILPAVMAALLLFSACAAEKGKGGLPLSETEERGSGLTPADPLAGSPFGESLPTELPLSPEDTGSTGSDTGEPDPVTGRETETEKETEGETEPPERETGEDDLSDLADYVRDVEEDEDEDEGVYDATDGKSLFDPDFMEISTLSDTFQTYDVPLEELKQKYVVDMAKEFGVPPELIFAVMKVETGYSETTSSANGKYIGIMQIALSNLKRLQKKFDDYDVPPGLTEADVLISFPNNVKAGTYFLSLYYTKYKGDIDRVLMCYHRGEGGAIAKWNEGVYQDNYCRKVRTEMSRISGSR